MFAVGKHFGFDREAAAAAVVAIVGLEAAAMELEYHK